MWAVGKNLSDLLRFSWQAMEGLKRQLSNTGGRHISYNYKIKRHNVPYYLVVSP